MVGVVVVNRGRSYSRRSRWQYCRSGERLGLLTVYSMGSSSFARTLPSYRLRQPSNTRKSLFLFYPFSSWNGSDIIMRWRHCTRPVQALRQTNSERLNSRQQVRQESRIEKTLRRTCVTHCWIPSCSSFASFISVFQWNWPSVEACGVPTTLKVGRSARSTVAASSWIIIVSVDASVEDGSYCSRRSRVVSLDTTC